MAGHGKDSKDAKEWKESTNQRNRKNPKEDSKGSKKAKGGGQQSTPSQKPKRWELDPFYTPHPTHVDPSHGANDHVQQDQFSGGEGGGYDDQGSGTYHHPPGDYHNQSQQEASADAQQSNYDYNQQVPYQESQHDSYHQPQEYVSETAQTYAHGSAKHDVQDQTEDNHSRYYDSQAAAGSSSHDVSQSYHASYIHSRDAQYPGFNSYAAAHRSPHDITGHGYHLNDVSQHTHQSTIPPLENIYDASDEEYDVVDVVGESHRPLSPFSASFAPADASHGPSYGRRTRRKDRNEAAGHSRDETSSMPSRAESQQPYANFPEISSGISHDPHQLSIGGDSRESFAYLDAGGIRATTSTSGQFDDAYSSSIYPSPAMHKAVDEGMEEVQQGMHSMNFQEPLIDAGPSNTQYTTQKKYVEESSYPVHPAGSGGHMDISSQEAVEQPPPPAKSSLGSSGGIRLYTFDGEGQNVYLDGLVDRHTTYPLISQAAIDDMGLPISKSSKNSKCLPTRDGDLVVWGRVELKWEERDIYDRVLDYDTTSFYVVSSTTGMMEHNVYLPHGFRGKTAKPEKPDTSKRHEGSSKHHHRKR